MELIETGNEVCNSIGRASAYGVVLSSSNVDTVTTRQGRDDGKGGINGIDDDGNGDDGDGVVD